MLDSLLRWTTGRLPRGVAIERAPGKGWGLFATRRFRRGACVYEFPVVAVESESLVLQTDHGPIVVDRYNHFTGPCTPAWLSWLDPGFPRALLGLMKVAVPARAADAARMAFDLITANGRCPFMFSAFDTLINHARHPSCRHDLSPRRVETTAAGVVIWCQTRARHNLQPGAELTVDYGELVRGFKTPPSWP